MINSETLKNPDVKPSNDQESRLIAVGSSAGGHRYIDTINLENKDHNNTLNEIKRRIDIIEKNDIPE